MFYAKVNKSKFYPNRKQNIDSGFTLKILDLILISLVCKKTKAQFDKSR